MLHYTVRWLYVAVNRKMVICCN